MNNYPVYTVAPASGELGKNGYLRLSGYQQLICFGAEEDVTSRGMALEKTISMGFAWAITGLVVDVARPVKSCAPVKCRTWLSMIRPPLFRREMEFYDDEGVLFSVAIFTVPLDLNNHSIITKPTEFMMTGVTGDPVVENAASRINGVPELEPVMERVVYPSDIDALGHMNNNRYGAFVYDALTETEREALSGPFRYTINFRHQLFEWAAAAISRGAADGKIYVRGFDKQSGANSFTSVLEFK